MNVLRWFLGGVCHQMAAHSFKVHGQVLPLCARCSGTYVGALAGLLTWRLRRDSRGTALPPLRVLVVLAGFVGLWGLDGFNSFLTLVPGTPHLYVPHNSLRLVTGMLYGLALATLVYPLFNYVAWAEPDHGRVTPGLRALVAPLGALALIAGMVHTGSPVVLYGLLAADLLGLLGTLTLVNGAGVLVVLRREGQAEGWGDLWLPLGLGLLLTVAEISGLAVLRGLLASRGLMLG